MFSFCLFSLATWRASSDQNENSDLAMLRGALEQPLFPLFVPAEAGRHLAERGERVCAASGRVPQGGLDPVEFVTETDVLPNQRVEIGFEFGVQAVQRREMDLLFEREMRVERPMEAVERLPHLEWIAALERAQRGRLERVEIAMLYGDASRLMGEAKAESRLVALCHVARNSTAVL